MSMSISLARSLALLYLQNFDVMRLRTISKLYGFTRRMGAFAQVEQGKIQVGKYEYETNQGYAYFFLRLPRMPRRILRGMRVFLGIASPRSTASRVPAWLILSRPFLALGIPTFRAASCNGIKSNSIGS